MGSEKGKSVKKKRFSLEPKRSASPKQRAALLVSNITTLIPQDTPFLKMNFPKGVFNRAYEEFYHLDKILYVAAGAYEIKKFESELGLGFDFAGGLSVIDDATRQLGEPDWLKHPALGGGVFNALDQERYAGIGDELYQARLSAVSDEVEMIRNSGALDGLDYARNSGALDGLHYARLAGTVDDVEQARIAAMLNGADQALNSGALDGIDYARLAGTANEEAQAHLAAGLDGLEYLRNSDALKGLDIMSQSDGAKNPYSALLNQIPETPEIDVKDSPLPSFTDNYFDHISKEATRQGERDKLQKELTELSAKHLKLNAEQFEENKKSQAEQAQANKHTFWLTVFVAIVTTLGFLVALIGTIFEAQEIKSFFSSAGHQLIDIAVSLKNTISLQVSSYFEKDV